MFHKNSGIEKSHGKEGGGGGWREYQDFPSNFFVSVPKPIVGDSFSVSLFSGIEKFYT